MKLKFSARRNSVVKEMKLPGSKFVAALSPHPNPLSEVDGLQRLAAGEAGFDVVPPFNLIAFVSFPAE